MITVTYAFIFIVYLLSYVSAVDITKLTCYGGSDQDMIVVKDQPFVIGRPGKQGPPGDPGPPGNCGDSDCNNLKERIDKLENRLGQADVKAPNYACDCGELPALKLRLENLEKIVDELNKGGRVMPRAEPESCNNLEVKKTGLHTIYPFSKEKGLEVYCDFETFEGPWLVFQRRMDGTQDFFKSWSDYVEGFGDKNKEFWLGLEYLHLLTHSKDHILRVDLEDFQGNKAYAEYSNFSISSNESMYTIKVSGYSGTAGDGLKIHDGEKFSTKDNNKIGCSKTFRGAWWFRECHHAHLNGPYGKGLKDGHGIVWEEWKGVYESLKSTEMKMRPIQF